MILSFVWKAPNHHQPCSHLTLFSFFPFNFFSLIKNSTLLGFTARLSNLVHPRTELFSSIFVSAVSGPHSLFPGTFITPNAPPPKPQSPSSYMLHHHFCFGDFREEERRRRVAFPPQKNMGRQPVGSHWLRRTQASDRQTDVGGYLERWHAVRLVCHLHSDSFCSSKPSQGWFSLLKFTSDILWSRKPTSSLSLYLSAPPLAHWLSAPLRAFLFSTPPFCCRLSDTPLCSVAKVACGHKRCAENVSGSSTDSRW